MRPGWRTFANTKLKTLTRFGTRCAFIFGLLSAILAGAVAGRWFARPLDKYFLPEYQAGVRPRGGGLGARPRPGEPYVNSNGLTLGRTILASTKFASCETHKVKTNGGVVDDWLIFQERNHINVMVQRASDGKFLLFRQTKYALDGDVLAPVGGLVDDGERPLASAKREVAEEAGMVCAHWRTLGRPEGHAVQANRYGGLGFYFHACGCSGRDARAVAALAGTAGLDDEEQRATWVTARELKAHVFAGDVQEIKWTATAAMTLLSMDDGSGCPAVMTGGGGDDQAG